MGTEECRKCHRRYKLLTDAKRCAYCDYKTWHGKYFVTPIRDKK